MTRPGTPFTDVETLRIGCRPVDSNFTPSGDACDDPLAWVSETTAGEQVAEVVQSQRGSVIEEEPDPDLRMEVAKGLSSITYRTSDSEITVEDPNSLWPCTCQAAWANNGGYACPVHRHQNGESIATAFTDGTVELRYDGLEIYWFNSEYLFPVTTDTIYAYENLLADGLSTAEFSSVLDLGCGTGFLAVGLSARNPNISKLFMADQYTTPLAVSSLNHWENAPGSTRHLLLTDGLERANGGSISDLEQIDLCVSNPPYLPEMEYRPAGVSVPGFVGTDLLQRIIESGEVVSDTLYVHMSTLAEPEATAAAEKGNASLTQVGTCRTVPFRVPATLHCEQYIDFLRSRGLKARPESRYPYWHDIVTYRVTYSSVPA